MGELTHVTIEIFVVSFAALLGLLGYIIKTQHSISVLIASLSAKYEAAVDKVADDVAHIETRISEDSNRVTTRLDSIDSSIGNLDKDLRTLDKDLLAIKQKIQ